MYDSRYFVATFLSPEPLSLICNDPVEPLVSRPRDQETAGSEDENVVAYGIWSVWTVFIVGLQPRDKASTLVYKTIQFFSKNLTVWTKS